MTSWSWAVQELNSIRFATIIGLSNVARVKFVYCNTRPLGFIRDMVVCLMTGMFGCSTITLCYNIYVDKVDVQKNIYHANKEILVISNLIISLDNDDFFQVA